MSRSHPPRRDPVSPIGTDLPLTTSLQFFEKFVSHCRPTLATSATAPPSSRASSPACEKRTLSRQKHRLLTEIIQMRNIMRFLRDESGATAIEYGLIAAGISVAIIAAVKTTGTKLTTTFTSVTNAL